MPVEKEGHIPLVPSTRNFIRDFSEGTQWQTHEESPIKFLADGSSGV